MMKTFDSKRVYGVYDLVSLHNHKCVPYSFIDIDKITAVPAAQQDRNKGTFHLVTQGRTYELMAIDEPTMKWYCEALNNCMLVYTK